MSYQARVALVNSPNTIFRSMSQRSDIVGVDPPELYRTQTTLIALLSDLIAKGHIMEFTAIKSDHHDDSDLGLHCHFNGYCADLWPLASPREGDYLDANDPRFVAFCRDAGIDPYRYQTGLAGSAWTHDAITAAGSGVFHDDGGDHIHLGAK